MNRALPFNQWVDWGLLATLATGLPLLNAWLGFPLPATFDGLYSAFGGVIPYSDAGGYFGGSYQFNNVGYLNYWNMRRPINALFLAFRLKITDGNFWYMIVIQAALCAVALTLYLRTLQKNIGTLAAFIALGVFYYYAQSYIHTTMSETLGLTLGTLSFVLLWNGFLNKNRLIFNTGIASLTVALSTRAGPNFIVPALFLLVYLKPFTSSKLKDLFWFALSVVIPFVFMTMLSSLFEDPNTPGAPLSNFSYTLYGLVNGGKTWLFAFQDPYTIQLLEGKTEAQQAIILYAKSWEIFRDNPLALFIGMVNYFGGFVYWFIRQLAFGSGIIKGLTTTVAIIFWSFITYRIYTKRFSFQQEFLFLSIAFLGIAASSCIIWKDGGIRVFAVAIPFIGALMGFAFSAASSQPQKSKTPENIGAACLVGTIILSAILTPFIPSFSNQKPPDITNINVNKTPDEEIFLTYKPSIQPYLMLDNAPGLHFWTLDPLQTQARKSVYEDSPFGIELNNIAIQYSNSNFTLLEIYDYISNSHKFIISDKNILNINSQWVIITGDFIDKDKKTIYKANNYLEFVQK